MKGAPNLMPVAMIEKLHEAHAECLIIPEWSNSSYYAVSSPRPYALRSLGGISVNNEQVARALLPLLDAPAGDSRSAHRLAAIDVAGQVRCREA